MNPYESILRANLAAVGERIARAAAVAGRDANQIALVCVTKYVDVELAAALNRVGASDLGESRPQELWSKAEQLPGVRWHLIGHLQRNKVRRSLPYVGLIHGVDSERLLESINSEAHDLGRKVEILLEVNTSGDAAKHGIAPNELERLVSLLPKYENVQARGLMTMAARDGGESVARRNFSTLRDLRDALSSTINLEELSMGMSGDFEAAIAEGATIVRIGSALWEGIR